MHKQQGDTRHGHVWEEQPEQEAQQGSSVPGRGRPQRSTLVVVTSLGLFWVGEEAMGSGNPQAGKPTCAFLRINTGQSLK